MMMVVIVMMKIVPYYLSPSVPSLASTMILFLQPWYLLPTYLCLLYTYLTLCNAAFPFRISKGGLSIWSPSYLIGSTSIQTVPDLDDSYGGESKDEHHDSRVIALQGRQLRPRQPQPPPQSGGPAPTYGFTMQITTTDPKLLHEFADCLK
jgi:hypothetical protein